METIMEAVLDERAVSTLRAAVDRIIPPDKQTPGGVEAGALDYLLKQLSPSGDFPDRLPDYRAGLAALDELSRETMIAPFADLGPAAQDAALTEFSSRDRRFFSLMVEQAQEGFYTSPAAFAMIGWKVTG